MASVSADDIRDVTNVSSAEVPDAKVLKMIKRADVALETGDCLGEMDCSQTRRNE